MRGRLTIFLGYAAGVGKTYKMLEETQRLKREGHDIVVGYFEPHGRQDTIAKIEGLELIPRRRVTYRGAEFEEMDTSAILARKPELCAVDEFPHTNVPGSPRSKRWEDVMLLLENGIGVLTTMNIQHLESLNDQVREIANVQVRETIPDWVVKQADEVVLVDVPPQALLNRLAARCNLRQLIKRQQALNNFFKRIDAGGALREMALRQTAHEVDVRQVGDVDDEVERPHLDPHYGIAGNRSVDSPGAARGGLLKGGLLRGGLRVASGGDGGITQRLRGKRLSGIWNSRGACILRRAFSKGGKRGGNAGADFTRRNGVTQIFLAKLGAKPAIPILWPSGIS